MDAVAKQRKEALENAAEIQRFYRWLSLKITQFRNRGGWPLCEFQIATESLFDKKVICIYVKTVFIPC